MNKLLAQTTVNLVPSDTTFAGLKDITPTGIVQALFNGILAIAALVFFFMLVIGGVRWILSGGDKGQTEAARSQVTAALIGLVIVFAAFAIATLIGQFFGIGAFTSLTLPSAKGL